jgi:aldehyde dehydrogenase (NAD+)
MIVPRPRLEEVVALAKEAAEAYVVGDPMDEATTLGPMVNRKQFDHVQRLIQAGIDEGARLVTGGTGRPEGVDRGYFVRPTVFADVLPEMRVAQEEIFGPVLSIQAYDTEDEAIALANNTVYGLAAAVQSADKARALAIARRIRAGHVYINYDAAEYSAVPFGGWKQSGVGYEHDEWGMGGFQLIKAVLGVGE